MTPIRPSRHFLGSALASMCLTLATANGAHATPTNLSDAVPADAAAAYLAAPAGSGQSQSDAGASLGMATFLIDQARQFGLLSGLDAECRAWVDVLASLSVVLDHPHSLALFDVRASALASGGHRLTKLHGALVVHANGQNGAIEERIQHLLNTYTNSAESTLKTQTTEHNPVHTLRDKRLPEWAVLTWGPVGDRYVMTIGEGTFDRIKRVLADSSLSLTRDPWFDRAFKAAGGPTSAMVVYARPARLHDGADQRFARKVDQVRRAMFAEKIDRGLWTLAYVGRAVESKGYFRRDGVDQLSPLTTSHLAGVAEHLVIPESATGYALFDVDPQALCDTVCQAYLAARSPPTRRRLRAYWQDLQVKADVSIAKDIIAHLGRGVAIHDSPRHALRLPLAWTIVMPVAGDVQELRTNIDRLAGVWRDELSQAGSLRLRKDPDDIWYLFFGINGPAVGVSDRWLVASFSPEAVRQNMAHLEALDPTATTVQPPADR